MVWKAAKPNVTEKQSKILCEIIDSRTSRHDHIQRAQIIQKSSEGLSDRKIAKLLNIGRIAVATWRNGISYKNQILKILSDSPRSGAPPKFSAEQICQIINVACEVPEELDLPLSHWSLSSLSDEIVKRKIVDSISISQLAVFLKSGEDKTS